MIGRGFVCALLLTLGSACGLTTTQPAAEPPVNVLVGVHGDVALKRQGWSRFAATGFGTFVGYGDLLRLGPDGAAAVVCADLTLIPLSPGTTDVPCKVDRQPLSTANGKAAPTRAPPPPTGIPVLIAPRATALVDPHPVIRWVSVDSADEYLVTVRGGDTPWSRVVSRQVTLSYPPDAPTLRPGQHYSVEIVSRLPRSGERHSSNEEKSITSSMDFSVATIDEAEAVRARAKKIGELAIDDTARTFIIAHLYAAHALRAEAMQLLASIPDDMDAPVVEEMYGDLLGAVGVTRQAEDHYNNALNLLRGSSDEEAIARAHDALGEVYAAYGDVDGAQQQWRQAAASYDALGDTSTAGQVLRKAHP